ALQHPENSRFACPSAALVGNDTLTLRMVHVASLAADVGLVDFHTARQLAAGFILHRQTNPVQHEPCGLLGYTDCASQFITADAVLGIRNQPHRNEPLVEADRAVLHDGPDLHGELPLGVLFGTFPDAAFADEGHPLGAASGALDDAIRPA